jgi:hypothetical protein
MILGSVKVLDLNTLAKFSIRCRICNRFRTDEPKYGLTWVTTNLTVTLFSMRLFAQLRRQFPITMIGCKDKRYTLFLFDKARGCIVELVCRLKKLTAQSQLQPSAGQGRQQ